MGSLWHSCAKVHELIEVSFGVVSGVGPGIGVLDGGLCIQGEVEVLGVSPICLNGVFECIFKTEMY